MTAAQDYSKAEAKYNKEKEISNPSNNPTENEEYDSQKYKPDVNLDKAINAPVEYGLDVGEPDYSTHHGPEWRYKTSSEIHK